VSVRPPSTVLSTTVVTAAASSVSRKVQGRASSAVPWFASLLLCVFSFPVVCIHVLFSAIFLLCCLLWISLLFVTHF